MLCMFRGFAVGSLARPVAADAAPAAGTPRCPRASPRTEALPHPVSPAQVGFTPLVDPEEMALLLRSRLRMRRAPNGARSLTRPT